MRNVSGTGDNKARDYSTWKQFYEEGEKRKWPRTCCVSFCKNNADSGAHVQFEDKRGVFIVPMCTEDHNNPHNKDWLHVKRRTIAIRVYREDTRVIKEKHVKNTTCNVDRSPNMKCAIVSPMIQSKTKKLKNIQQWISLKQTAKLRQTEIIKMFAGVL